MKGFKDIPISYVGIFTGPDDLRQLWNQSVRKIIDNARHGLGFNGERLILRPVEMKPGFGYHVFSYAAVKE